MNIDNLTFAQMKSINNFFSKAESAPNTLNRMIGDIVIIRTYSAGVWFGTLSEKAGKEVILKDARRMWRWWTLESISLSSIAIHGADRDKSKIAPPVDHVWLEAIEIIPCTDKSISSIEGAPNAISE